MPVGLLLYGLGIYLETVSEVQRKAFKEAPGNKDKPFSGGLFGLATNMYVFSEPLPFAPIRLRVAKYDLKAFCSVYSA